MIRAVVIGFAAILILGPYSNAAEPPTGLIEPSELTKRPDLIGRSIAVEDRVRIFMFHPGTGHDELSLKRTPVVFRLPPRLRPEGQPRQPCVRVEGVLSREGDQWYCDVTSLESLPREMTRLNNAVARLPQGDYKGRLAWSRWAEHLGKEFRDDELMNRARELEGDSIRIEADRPSADPGGTWLALAQRARDRHIGGAEAEALAHRGLRALLQDAKTTDAIAAVLKKIESFFPAAAGQRGDEAMAAKWQALYARDPASAYRSAPATGRAAFDHYLWADAAQRLLEFQVAADPTSALSLSEKAESQLPDRPELSARFVSIGLQAATRDLAKLRQSEVESLARIYREKLKQPDKALELLRTWLKEQRTHRIGSTDAEGRVALANQYEKLLGDEKTAVALLREAWAIDPDSKEIADLFRRKGYRKVDGEWVEPGANQSGEDSGESSARNEGAANESSFKNLTQQEVRARIGAKPTRVVRSATQGQVIEQWIYQGEKGSTVINFRCAPEQAQPTVVSYYSVPTSALRSGPP